MQSMNGLDVLPGSQVALNLHTCLISTDMLTLSRLWKVAFLRLAMLISLDDERPSFFRYSDPEDVDVADDAEVH